MTPAFEGTVEAVTFLGNTYEVFNAAIAEANHEICDVVLGQNLTTEPVACSSGAAMRALDEFKRNRAPFSVTCEVVIGIRDRRRLLIGRPRPKRATTKDRNAETRTLRRALVEMAGWCRHLSSNQIRSVIEITQLCFPFARRVSVPRSLRPLLGRYVGGNG